jgi:hypothetical protein
MIPNIKYYYTTFGDVYAGIDANELDFRDLAIIVQADKLRDYRELSHKDKTLDKIKEYANVIPLSAIAGVIDAEKIPEQQRPNTDNWWKGEYDRKNMFVFGAGASAYCVTGSRKVEFENDDLRPPLGNGLFASKFRRFYDNYDGVKLSLFDLQYDKANVEEYLEEEWKEVQENGNQAVMSRHINIQFYLQELLMEISKRITAEYYNFNLYAKLADKLQKINARDKKKHFAFVSFNQDTILENFLSKYFKRPLSNLDDYVDANDSPFCIFKPHGSWNWGWKFSDKVTNRQKVLFDSDVNFFKLYYEILGNHINMVDWNSWGLELMFNKHRNGKFTIDKSRLSHFDHTNIGNFYPAILLPYRDKDEFTMPPNHYHQLDHFFTYVENLFIIGWKGNEALFNKVLIRRANKINHVIIVDPNPKVVEENLKDLLAKPNVKKVIYNDFDAFVRNGLDKEIS